MSISFVVAESIEPAELAENAVEYSDEAQEFLRKNKQMFNGNIEILVRLDPYCDTCILNNEINLVKEAAQLIQDTLKSLSELNDILEELLDFTELITEFCNKAINNEQCLIVIGD